MSWTDAIYRSHRALFNEGALEDFFPLHRDIATDIDYLITKWHEQSPTGPYWKEILEPLAGRISYAALSLQNLLEGTRRGTNSDGPLFLSDLPSIYTLARTEIEAYLTFYYLYMDDKADASREWRYQLFVAHGLYSRQHVISDITELQEQQLAEKERIDRYITAIFNNANFLAIPLSERNRKLPTSTRIPTSARIHGWERIITRSKLNTEEFKNRWGLYSNHAHTEYISILQLRDFIQNGDQHPYLLIQVIKCSLMILSVFIKEFVEVAEIEHIYSTIPENTRRAVDFFESFATRPG